MVLKQQKTLSTLDEIRYAVAAIKDKKGESVRILDVRGKSPVTDYIIVATGTSNPHIKAIKAELDHSLKQAGIHLIGEDHDIGSGWVVVDAFDFMIHIQTEEIRDLYRLERLWKDAVAVEV